MLSGWSGPSADELRLQWYEQRLCSVEACKALAEEVRRGCRDWKFLAYKVAADPGGVLGAAIQAVRLGQVEVSEYGFLVRAICRQVPALLDNFFAIDGALTADTSMMVVRFAPRERFGDFVHQLATTPYAANALPVFATPKALSDYVGSYPDQQWLIRALNFCEDEPTPTDAKLLKSGAWFVGPFSRVCENLVEGQEWADSVFDTPEAYDSTTGIPLSYGLGRELLLHVMQKRESESLARELERMTLPSREATAS